MVLLRQLAVLADGAAVVDGAIKTTGVVMRVVMRMMS
jgi:hypothetical protein